MHRDVKPGNVVLGGPEGADAKLADLGLMKSLDTAWAVPGLTLTGQAGGTPEFMPREQLLDFRDLGPPSDVWAVAATFYRLLTGALPRDLNPGQDPVLAVLSNPVVPIEQRDSRIPASLAALINRALAPDPAARYPSALEMLAQLHALPV